MGRISYSRYTLTPIKPAVFLRASIRPALHALSRPPYVMDTCAAQALILGTGITESNLQYRRQIGGGPALGLMQVEPETHEDLYNNFLRFHPDLLKVMHWLRGDGMSLSAALEENDVYACAVARLLYYRHADPLPILTPLALAHYHKKLYNTGYGATDPTKSQSCFKTAIETVNAQKGL